MPAERDDLANPRQREVRRQIIIRLGSLLTLSQELDTLLELNGCLSIQEK